MLKTIQSDLIPGLAPTTDGFFYNILGLEVDTSGNAYISYNEGQERAAIELVRGNLGMLKISAANKQLWNRILVDAAPNNVYPRTFINGDFKVDSSGNIYLVSSATTYDFSCNNPTPPDFAERCGVSNNGYFIHKFNTDGMELWKKQIDTQKTGEDFVEIVPGVEFPLNQTFTPRLILDAHNTIYVAGETAASFNGFSNKGGTDIFVVRTDSNGNRRWVTQFGGAGYDKANDLAISSGLHVGGSFGSVPNSFSKDSLLARISRSDGRIANLLGR